MPPLGALDWQLLQIGFGAGLFTKTDKRFSSPPSLDIARDVQYEELGGVQTRLPFAALSNSIFGGGTLSNCRRLAVVNGELCVFTNTALYSWNAQQGSWVSRGTHLAVSETETARFATTGDQIDGDRAELNGTIVVAWTEGTQVYAGALDKTTGSVLVSPTAVSTAVGRPRLVALATRILLFTDAGANNLTARAIDPASPAAGIGGAGTSILSGTFNANYDVVKIPGADQCALASCLTPTASYAVRVINATPAIIQTRSPGRVCDGPIAISVVPDGSAVQVIRANFVNIQGDLLALPALGDTFTAQAVGTSEALAPVQIAAAHRSVQDGGAYRCYAFWTYPIAIFQTPRTRSNWVDTANALGTQGLFAEVLTVASRAFDYSGSVYLWLAFGESTTFGGSGGGAFQSIQLQNTYFLYRDNGLLSNAKAVADHGGGTAPSAGRLPAVTLTSGSATYSWCATERRRFVAGGIDHVNFAARAPVDVVFTFDDNSARRSVQLGAALYVSGGEVLAYDGVRLVEAGFHIYPWIFFPANAAGGAIVTGTYFYKETWRYHHATGESERSTTGTTGSVSVTTGRVAFTFNQPLVPTHKLTVPPAVEMWRTTIAPGAGAPFYLVSSNDPTALSGSNRYIPNDPTSAALPTFNDDLADTSITGNETNPENDGVLEVLAPPAATIIIATDTRLFLAGVAGDPDRVWYSRERNDGEVASFNDGLTIDVPPAGGGITALWIMDGVLYVGRQYAIYALPGTGFDNTGGGAGFGPAQVVSVDVGPVSQEAQCLTPLGIVMFTSKGYYLMDRSRGLRYIGGAVSSFDSDTVLSMDVMTSRHEVRVLTASRMLVWTYTDAVDLVDAQTPGGMGQWSERTISDGLDAVLWNGTYVYLTASGPKQEQSAYSGLSYGIDLESSWIKLNGLQGYGKVSAILILGEYRSAHLLRVRLARDYQYDGAGNVVYFDDKAWSPSPTTVGSALQVRHSPSASNGNCEALKIRITAVAELARATLATASALSPTVTTSGTAWAATWAAANTGTPGISFPGLMGNSITMTVAFASGSTPSIDVRDHFAWNASLGRWREQQNNVGVLVTGTNASTTVAALEAAIAAATKLCTLQTPDATPGKLVAITTLSGTSSNGPFSGGSYTSPSGEAIKLTGIALRVGLKPGLYNRLPAAQKE